MSHSDPSLIFDPQPPRDLDNLRTWMTGKDIEGIVWQHQTVGWRSSSARLWTKTKTIELTPLMVTQRWLLAAFPGRKG